MAYVWADRVLETSTVTGTGAATLLGAVDKHRTFAAVCSVSDTLPYVIIHLSANEWEVGLGTYSGANTLTRTTVQASSNAGAAVNFSAGTKRIGLSNTALSLLPLTSGGTAAATAADARTNLGLVAGGAGDIWVEKAGDTMTGPLSISMTDSPLSASNDGNITLNLSGYGSGIAPAFNTFRARGTEASPTVLANGDTMLAFRTRGYHGAGFTGTIGEFRFDVIEPTPSASAFALNFRVLLPPLGSATRSEVLEVSHAVGLELLSNVVIDENRLHRLRQYTVATLPTAGTAGRLAAVTDATAPTYNAALVGGGAINVPVYDNGAAWVSH